VLLAVLLTASIGIGCADADEKGVGDRVPKKTLVATLGDSITAGSPRWDPDPLVRRRLGAGADRSSQFQHWAGRGNPDLRFRNCGVFGERTDEIAARFARCARGADVLVVQGGINDIAQRRPVEMAAADLRRMVRRGRRVGLGVAITDVLPWDNGGSAAEEPITTLNRLIARIAREEDVRPLQFHTTLEDPDRPGTFAPGMTDDGDHPSIEGYRRLGERAFRLPVTMGEGAN